MKKLKKDTSLKVLFTFICMLWISCSLRTQELKTPKEGILVQKRNAYLAPSVKRNLESEQQILKLLQTLVNWTLEKDYSKLPELVDPKKGLYVDLKAEWNYKKLLDELKNPNSYFEIFFFDKEKLIREKNSTDVWTVRELLILSGGLKADLFFESNESCEVKLIFDKSSKHQTDLNNPYFIKVNGSWKVYRLF